LIDIAGPEGHREVLLDGAHNPAGAMALATALDDLRPYLVGGDERRPRPMTLVVASMADKDVDGIVVALARAASFSGARVICTQLAVPRAMPAAELAARWAALTPLAPIVIKDPAEALDLALAGPPGPIVVAGSLYLVGAARARLVDDPLLRDPVVAAA
jgi:dihydrofolate synthase/folylpolyglutamate synthase